MSSDLITEGYELSVKSQGKIRFPAMTFHRLKGLFIVIQ